MPSRLSFVAAVADGLLVYPFFFRVVLAAVDAQQNSNNKDIISFSHPVPKEGKEGLDRS